VIDYNVVNDMNIKLWLVNSKSYLFASCLCYKYSCILVFHHLSGDCSVLCFCYRIDYLEIVNFLKNITLKTEDEKKTFFRYDSSKEHNVNYI